jgi:hypothetical protein
MRKIVRHESPNKERIMQGLFFYNEHLTVYLPLPETSAMFKTAVFIIPYSARYVALDSHLPPYTIFFYAFHHNISFLGVVFDGHWIVHIDQGGQNIMTKNSETESRSQH